MKIELLEMGDEGDWECEIVHEDGRTTKLEATMESIPKSGNIPAVGPGTSTFGTSTFSHWGTSTRSPWDTTTTFGSPFASTPSSTNTGTNH